MEVANAKALIPHPCFWEGDRFDHHRWQAGGSSSERALVLGVVE